MATIATGGVTIPAWVLATLTGAFLTVLVALSGAGLLMWRDVHDAATVNQNQDRRMDAEDRRLDALEPMKAQVSGLDAKADGLAATAKDMNRKIDLLLGAQMQRH